MTTARILPAIDPGAAPPPGDKSLDARTEIMLSPADTTRILRPHGGRLPKKGNASQRAARRAQERAERAGRLAYHREGTALVRAFAAKGGAKW